MPCPEATLCSTRCCLIGDRNSSGICYKKNARCDCRQDERGSPPRSNNSGGCASRHADDSNDHRDGSNDGQRYTSTRISPSTALISPALALSNALALVRVRCHEVPVKVNILLMRFSA